MTFYQVKYANNKFTCYDKKLSVVFVTTKSETHKRLKDYRNDPIRNTVMFFM